MRYQGYRGLAEERTGCARGRALVGMIGVPSRELAIGPPCAMIACSTGAIGGSRIAIGWPSTCLVRLRASPVAKFTSSWLVILPDLISR